MFPGECANVYPKLSGIKVAERLMIRKFQFMQIFAGVTVRRYGAMNGDSNIWRIPPRSLLEWTGIVASDLCRRTTPGQARS